LCFYKQKTNIKFALEEEQHNCIDFQDLAIHHKKTNLEFAICRKHTRTDIILNDSCHPYEHKISSINYVMNRVHTYPITKAAKEKDLNIKDTLHNNEYNVNLGMRHPNRHRHNKNTDPQHQKTKWATYTDSGNETKKNYKTL
jgi:hypothetical protein